MVWRRIDEVPPAPKTILYIYGIAGKVVSNHTRSFLRRSRLDEKLRNLGKPGGAPAKLYIDGNKNWGWVSFQYEQDPGKQGQMVLLHKADDPAVFLFTMSKIDPRADRCLAGPTEASSIRT